LRERGVLNDGCYDKLIFNKIKTLMGGNLRYMLTGSAPLAAEVSEFLQVAFCCPMLEGYGQTETSAGSCISSVVDRSSGHVGGPMACNKIRLRDVPDMGYLSTDNPPRGEICFKGSNVFRGYFKNPDKT
jgi:long-chain acyl-CoA synthetase